MTIDVVAVWAEAPRPSDRQPVMGMTGTPDGLPWPPNDGDLRHFREVTRDRVLIMGHKTFRLLPEALKSRRALQERPIIVLVTVPNQVIDDYPDLQIQPIGWVDGEDRAAQLLKDAPTWWGEQPAKGVAIVGGRAVIELFAPLTDRLEVTFFRETYDGDALAPSLRVFDGFTRASSTTPDEFMEFVTFTKEHS